jgi:biotin carboxyl carrier protein
MEARTPLLSDEELARLPGVRMAVRLGPSVVLVFHHDGSTSFATRAPSGELWVDRRPQAGATVRTMVAGGPSSRAPRRAGAAAERDDSRITARSGGTVARVHVTAGEAVALGQTLVTIELMKMQLHVMAPRAGVVTSVAVAPGQAVEKGALLVCLG